MTEEMWSYIATCWPKWNELIIPILKTVRSLFHLQLSTDFTDVPCLFQFLHPKSPSACPCRHSTVEANGVGLLNHTSEHPSFEALVHFSHQHRATRLGQVISFPQPIINCKVQELLRNRKTDWLRVLEVWNNTYYTGTLFPSTVLRHPRGSIIFAVSQNPAHLFLVVVK